MKPSVLIILLLALGIGFAAGSFLQPQMRNLLGIASHAKGKAAGALSGNDVDSGAGKEGRSAKGGTLLGVSGPKDLASILKETNSYHRTEELLAYIESLSPEQIPDAVDQLNKKAGHREYLALSLLVSRWVEVDPQGALASLAKTQDRQMRGALIGSIYKALAAQDPAGAMGQCQLLTKDWERNIAIRSVIMQVSQKDPAQALAMSQQVKSAPFFNDSYFIFLQWGQKDANQATQAALQLSGRQKDSAISAIANTLSQNDPMSALEWLKQLPEGQIQNSARQSVVGRLANVDPQAAVNYVKGLPQNTERNNLIQNVASQMVETDPQAALALVEEIPPSPASHNVMENLLFRWAQTDPKSASDYVSAMPADANGRDNMIRNVANMWAQSDPQGAITWITQLPDGESKTSAFSSAISQWATMDPARASAYVQTMPEGPARLTAMQSVAKGWGESDPEAALQWASTFPEVQKTEVYGGIAWSWGATDPAKAAAWLTQLPAGATRDKAVRDFIHQIMNGEDYAQATHMAESIGDQHGREAELLDIFGKWMRSDPNTATPMVQSSSLSVEQKKGLLQTK